MSDPAMARPLRVLHVVPSFYPADAYGGPVQSVYRLCRESARIGCQVRVVSTNANGTDRVLRVDTARPVDVGDGVEVRYHRRLGRHSASPGLLAALPGACRWADVVHVTGVYSFPTIPTLFICRLFDRAVVWSPRGSLQRWSGSTRAQLKSVWERTCVMVSPRRLAIHVTSESEAQAAAHRIRGTRVAIIPNGIVVSDPKPRVVDRPGCLRILYLGRLHPIKAVDRLIEACRLLRDEPSTEWSLTVAGTGEPTYLRALRDQVRALDLQPYVSFVGHVDSATREQLFATSDLLILPSHSENFGLVVAEALAAGVPVVAGRGTPWADLEAHGCGRWVDNDSTSIAAAIRDLAQGDLREMGARGKRWMQADYAWSAVAQRMCSLYEAVRAC